MSKVTSAIWGPCEEYILTGHENGEINQFDIKVSGTAEVLGLK